MRLKILLPCLIVALVAAAGMTIWSGCDVGSATEEIHINPSSATLSKGQSQTFTVSGGYEYTWTLDPDNGTASLEPRSGDTVTFTLLQSSSSSSNGSAVVTVGVTSFIPGVPAPSSGTNNTASGGYTASDSAIVNILNGLTLAPGSATIAAGSSMGLTASGGSGSYVWSVSGVGSLSATAGGSVTFVAGSTAGKATITITDSDGLTASCTVTVTGSGGSSLTITPSSTHVAALASLPIFATGGSGSYTSWVVTGPNSAPNNGTLNTTSGAAIIYTAPAGAGSFAVTVTDSAGTPATCAITVP